MVLPGCRGRRGASPVPSSHSKACSATRAAISPETEPSRFASETTSVLPVFFAEPQDRLPVQRVERDGLDHLRLYAVLVGELVGRPSHVAEHQPVGDDRQVRPLPVDLRPVERDGVVLVRHLALEEPVGLLVLQEEDGVRVADGALEGALGVGGERGGHDFQARGVAEKRLDCSGSGRGPPPWTSAVRGTDGYGDRYAPLDR